MLIKINRPWTTEWIDNVGYIAQTDYSVIVQDARNNIVVNTELQTDIVDIRIVTPNLCDTLTIFIREENHNEPV